jgi:hypothetical protein
MATPKRDIPGLFMNDYARAALSLLLATTVPEASHSRLNKMTTARDWDPNVRSWLDPAIPQLAEHVCYASSNGHQAADFRCWG